MLSATVRPPNTLLICSVRDTPADAIWCGFMPTRSSPSKKAWPRSAGIRPVSRLNNVVLPAPFGPMMALRRPLSNATSTPSTAINPPNRLVNPSMVSAVAMRAAPRYSAAIVETDDGAPPRSRRRRRQSTTTAVFQAPTMPFGANITVTMTITPTASR